MNIFNILRNLKQKPEKRIVVPKAEPLEVSRRSFFFFGAMAAAGAVIKPAVGIDEKMILSYGADNKIWEWATPEMIRAARPIDDSPLFPISPFMGVGDKTILRPLPAPLFDTENKIGEVLHSEAYFKLPPTEPRPLDKPLYPGAPL